MFNTFEWDRSDRHIDFIIAQIERMSIQTPEIYDFAKRKKTADHNNQVHLLSHARDFSLPPTKIGHIMGVLSRDVSDFMLDCNAYADSQSEMRCRPTAFANLSASGSNSSG